MRQWICSQLQQQSDALTCSTVTAEFTFTKRQLHTYTIADIYSVDNAAGSGGLSGLHQDEPWQHTLLSIQETPPDAPMHQPVPRKHAALLHAKCGCVLVYRSHLNVGHLID